MKRLIRLLLAVSIMLSPAAVFATQHAHTASPHPSAPRPKPQALNPHNTGKLPPAKPSIINKSPANTGKHPIAKAPTLAKPSGSSTSGRGDNAGWNGMAGNNPSGSSRTGVAAQQLARTAGFSPASQGKSETLLAKNLPINGAPGGSSVGWSNWGGMANKNGSGRNQSGNAGSHNQPATGAGVGKDSKPFGGLGGNQFGGSGVDNKPFQCPGTTGGQGGNGYGNTGGGVGVGLGRGYGRGQNGGPGRPGNGGHGHGSRDPRKWLPAIVMGGTPGGAPDGGTPATPTDGRKPATWKLPDGGTTTDIDKYIDATKPKEPSWGDIAKGMASDAWGWTKSKFSDDPKPGTGSSAGSGSSVKPVTPPSPPIKDYHPPDNGESAPPVNQGSSGNPNQAVVNSVSGATGGVVGNTANFVDQQSLQGEIKSPPNANKGNSGGNNR
jgi:hypothetical protein